MSAQERCATEQGMPRWVRSRGALLGAMAVWLPLLLAEPAAQVAGLRPAWPSWLGLAVAAAAFLGCGVVGSTPRRTARGAHPLGTALLVVLAVTTLLLVSRSADSAALFSLLVIAAVVVLDGRPGLVAVGVVTALSAVTVWAAGGTAGRLSGTVVVTALSGLGSWTFRRLFAVIAELAATREALARVAVEQERERFSRDLHDLLGHTLSVVVVKAQAVRRLAARDAGAAAQHGADIEVIGRRALSEVRQAVAGYRGTGLAAELDRAVGALAAAGITATVTGAPASGALPDEVDELFGWVVREGSTNVIRHSGARRCVVTCSQAAGTARIAIADDGRGVAAAGTAATGAAAGPRGNGLAGLRERVGAAGGRLVSGPSDSGFDLSVEVPVPQPLPQQAVGAAR